jgi:hypothetical protein
MQNFLRLISGRSGVGSLVILGVGGGPCISGCGGSGTAGGIRVAVVEGLCVLFCGKPGGVMAMTSISRVMCRLVAEPGFLFDAELAAGA